MAITTTTRLGLYRWGADTDQFSRDQLDSSHGSLESGVVKWGQRAVGETARPSPSTTWTGALYYNKETTVLSYTDGVEWIDIPLLGKTTNVGANLILGEGVNIQAGTTTGTKIGTTTGQKIGFFNATPVVQPANTVSTRSALQTLGLISAAGDTRWEVRVLSGTANIRPASGTLGETIYEERTFSLLTWTGAAWVGPNPCGTINAFYGTTAPAGWLFCDGGSILAQYSELITLVGATTPDLRDKGIVGRTTVATAFSTTGQANITTSPVLFAFTPDTTTTAPTGLEVSAKALGNAETTSNVSPSVKMNYIIKV
jgi:hypothetical protein